MVTRIREYHNYERAVSCPGCRRIVEYHVIDIKGVQEPYIICPACGEKILIKQEIKGL